MSTDAGQEHLSVDEALSLADWRRQVASLYERVRANPDAEDAWSEWRATRDRLFAEHPQSPLQPDARTGFSGLPYFPFRPDARVAATLRPAEPTRVQIAASAGGSALFDRVAVADFRLDGNELSLEVYWLAAYGGGIFVPFRDATSGAETYGAGRYLWDSVKGADLGGGDGELVLDFNFAYHPSCAYDPRWVCPLAPPANILTVPIEAGERLS